MIAAWDGESVLPTKPELGAIGLLVVIKKGEILVGAAQPHPGVKLIPFTAKNQQGNSAKGFRGSKVYWEDNRILQSPPRLPNLNSARPGAGITVVFQHYFLTLEGSRISSFIARCSKTILMNPSTLRNHFDELLKIYADFSLREFRYKEGKTDDIRMEAKQLCEVYKDQCAQYVREHPELHSYLFGKGASSLGLDETTFFSWQHFSASLQSALARVQETIEKGS